MEVTARAGATARAGVIARSGWFWLALLLLLPLVGCAGSGASKQPGTLPEGQAERQEQPRSGSTSPPGPEEKGPLPGALLVVIDNHPAARPQSGLDKADLVYEAEAEGGLTRFLAVFYSREAPRIGPVRSARLYFAEIARAYNAPFAHAGGNFDVLAAIPRLGIKDLDEIYNASSSFWRSPERKMPHNLYTSTGRLWEGAAAKGFKPVPLPKLLAGEVEGGKPAEELSITYERLKGYRYTASYRYVDGVYRRYINGEPHLTDDGTHLEADNVVVLFARSVPVMREELQTDIRVTGEGEAFFFTRGRVYAGRWKKKNPSSHFEFLYSNAPMRFSPGRTWIQIAPGRGALTF